MEKYTTQPYGHNIHHIRSRSMRKCISDLLITLKKDRKIKWVAVTEDDVTRLEAVVGGFIFKFVHAQARAGREIPSYRGGTAVVGQRDERYILEIKDKLKIYGRALILNEWFFGSSPLLNQVAETFTTIKVRTKPIVTSTCELDKMRLPQCVRSVGKMIESL